MLNVMRIEKQNQKMRLRDKIFYLLPVICNLNQPLIKSDNPIIKLPW